MTASTMAKDHEFVVDPAFEFSAPQYCNLALELDRKIEYNDDNGENDEWFEEVHPLQEPLVKLELEPALSPSEFGDPVPYRVAETHSGSSKSRSGGRHLESVPSPGATSRTPRRTEKTPLSGSARRVRAALRPSTAEGGDEENTRRMLTYDEQDEEAIATEIIPERRRRNEVTHGFKQEKQAREVELLLRKHNRQLEARKREERMIKVRTRKGHPSSGQEVQTESPPPAASSAGSSNAVAEEPEEDLELKRMLEEHNRKVREARQRRSQANPHAVGEVSKPRSAEKGSLRGVGHRKTIGDAGGGLQLSRRPDEAQAQNSRKSAGDEAARKPKSPVDKPKKQRARTNMGSRRAENGKENVLSDRTKKHESSSATSRHGAKVTFTSAKETGKSVHQRRTNAHSELTELLKRHNSKVRTHKNVNSK